VAVSGFLKRLKILGIIHALNNQNKSEKQIAAKIVTSIIPGFNLITENLILDAGCYSANNECNLTLPFQNYLIISSKIIIVIR